VPTYKNITLNRCTTTLLLLLATLATKKIQAQFDIEDSHTTASLRGIHNAGGGVAWASGNNGTVLRTEDGGYLWQTCNLPPGAEKLDFRGIQAFDENTAIVMSSGKGDLSRIYKTTDGCQTWKLLFTNPDKEGFWDSVYANASEILVLGDSVADKIKLWNINEDSPKDIQIAYEASRLRAEPHESSFAASNSNLIAANREIVDKGWGYEKWWASGTQDHSYVTLIRVEKTACEPCLLEAKKIEVPLTQKSSSAGIFSIGLGKDSVIVAVGGDYKAPDQSTKTAAYSLDHGLTWYPPPNPPPR
jgi:photosystem II stability/assembly factor-like uncharacterized protein